MASIADSAQFVRLFDQNIREVAEARYKELPSMIPELFRIIKSDSAFEEFYEVGAVPDFEVFNGSLTYTAQSPGFHTRVEPKEFVQALQYERKLLDDKKFPVFEKGGIKLIEAAHRTREKTAVKAFSNSFSTSFDFMRSEENVALCSNSHTTKSGTSTSVGFDNLGTAALDKTSVAATRINMRKFRNDISERIEMSDNIGLIVPDTLADAAHEINLTPKSLDTAEGNKNMQAGRYKVIPYMRLDDTSTKDWWMVDLDGMKEDLFWIDRIMPEIKTTIDFNTYITQIAGYFRSAYGFKGWRWVFGNNVT